MYGTMTQEIATEKENPQGTVTRYEVRQARFGPQLLKIVHLLASALDDVADGRIYSARTEIENASESLEKIIKEDCTF